MPHPLEGVIVPLVTPLDETGRPDPDGAQRFLELLGAAGVPTLMLLGSNGEGALLPVDVVEPFVREVVLRWKAIRPSGAVVVNVSAPGTTDMQRRAEAALAGSPDVVMTSPPGYFRHRPDEIEVHLRALASFGHPFAIYNIPAYANPLPVEVFGAMLDEPRLVGVKDSSGDLAVLEALLAAASARPDVVVGQGDERRLLDGLRAGARGIVPGLANLAPGLAQRLYTSWAAGDETAAAAAQERLTGLVEIHQIRPGVPTVKGVLRDRGILPSDRCAPPLASLSAAERRRIRDFLVPFESELPGAW